MARTKTREQMRDAARVLADHVYDESVSDAQANYWIDQSLAHLWDLLVDADPDRYIVTPSSDITTTAGTYTYSLPADCYKLRALWKKLGTNRRLRVLPTTLLNAPGEMGDTYTGDCGPLSYYLRGNYIVFTSDPGAADFEFMYIPAPEQLATDASTFDGIAGWEAWIEHNVAIKMLHKEGTDASELRAEREKIEHRILKAASNRDVVAPQISNTFYPTHWRV